MPKYSNPRLKFPYGQQRKFILSVFEKSRSNAEGLAKIANVCSRTIRDWRREKFNITQDAVNTFCNKFKVYQPNNSDKLIEAWRNKKFEISRKGGLAYYQKYGLPGSLESRRRGGIAGMVKLRKLGLVAPVRNFYSPPRSIDLAEFVGIMLWETPNINYS